MFYAFFLYLQNGINESFFLSRKLYEKLKLNFDLFVFVKCEDITDYKNKLWFESLCEANSQKENMKCETKSYHSIHDAGQFNCDDNQYNPTGLLLFNTNENAIKYMFSRNTHVC